MNTIEMNAVAAASAPELRDITIPIGRVLTIIRQTILDLAGRIPSPRAATADPRTHNRGEQVRLLPTYLDDIDDILANATWEDAEWQ